LKGAPLRHKQPLFHVSPSNRLRRLLHPSLTPHLSSPLFTTGTHIPSSSIPTKSNRLSSTTTQATAAVAADRSSSAVEKLLSSGAGLTQLYRYPGLSKSKATTLLHRAQSKVSKNITGIDGELCYNISTKEPLSAHEAATLTWLLRETYKPEFLTPASVLDSKKTSVVEVSDYKRI